MFKHLKKRKGQSSVEYAILIIIVIGALLSIQFYIKRGIQGRLKTATDDISDYQYSPGNTNTVKTTSTKGATRDIFEKGATTSQMLQNESVTENMSSCIMNTQFEFWGK